MGVVIINIATNGAYAPSLFKSCRVGGRSYLVAVSFALRNRKISRPYEVQISEVLALCNAFSYLNGDGVFTCLESEAQAGIVCALEIVVVNEHGCFVSSCPTVGCGDLLLVCGAFVDYKGCATFLVVLQTDVNCYFIDTSLFNSYVEGDVSRSVAIAAVGVSIRHLGQIVARTHFVVVDVTAGNRVLVCIQTECIIELFGKCCGELVYVVSAVAVCIELGNYIGGVEFIVAVYANAVFDLVGVVIINIVTNGAYAPSLFESCRVGGGSYLVAVSFALNYRRNIRTGLRSGYFGLGSGLYGLGSGLYGLGSSGYYRLGSGLYGLGSSYYGLGSSGYYGLGSSSYYGLRSSFLRSGCCGSSGCRSGYCGLFRCGNLILAAKTGSNRQHHSDGHYQGQNAQNVLVFHYENLHKKFGAGLHGNIIS